MNMPTNLAIGDGIDSWKDIANYLERDVSTVIRWEKERGLPVHRIPGGQRQPVFAFKGELDAWLTGTEGGNGQQKPVEGREPNGATRSRTITAEPETAKPVALSGSVVSVKINAKWRWIQAGYWATGLGVALLLLATAYRYVVPSVLPFSLQLRGQQQLTANGQEKLGLVTDGKTLYFGQEQDGRFALAAMPVAGGPIRVLWNPAANVLPLDLSPDGNKLLALTWAGVESERNLWVVPLKTGEPRRLQKTMAHSAAWAPDGRSIAYAWGNGVYLTSEGDLSPREIGSFAEIPRELQWSKDGRRLRFILDNLGRNSAKNWGEIYGDGMKVRAVRPLPDLADDIAGNNWVRAPAWNGYFHFGTFQRPRGTPVWFAQFSNGWWEQSLHPVLMGSFLERVTGIAPLERSSRLFVLSEPQDRAIFVSFDTRLQVSRRILPGVSGRFLDYSRDGKWVAYVADDDHQLEISHADGTAARHITSEPGIEELPRWSPDGKRIAYSAQRPGSPWRIFVFNIASGVTKEASEGSDSQGAPTWSPDGRFLAYGGVRCEETNSCAIHRIDLATGKVQTLSNSEGLFTARWSPDGRYIAALQMTQHELMLLDVKAGTWRKLANAIDGTDLSWSSDSEYLYASVRGSDAGIVRIRISDGVRQKAMDLSAEDKTDLAEVDDMQFSLGPDDSVILHPRIHSEEIYAYDLRSR
jgi:Tol biopolymer transport system component